MSGDPSDDAILVYSDFVCPFCYLGKASLDRYRERVEEPPEVEWRFFDLRSHQRRSDGSLDPDAESGKDESYFEQVRANVERLSRVYDVEMAFEVARDVDSYPAHRLAALVREEYDPETFRSFYRAVFEALWEEGRDIEDPEVLEACAENAEVDRADVARALEEPEWEEVLSTQFGEAHMRGVTAVPTFVYGNRAARGVISPEQIDQLVRRTSGRVAPAGEPSRSGP